MKWGKKKKKTKLKNFEQIEMKMYEREKRRSNRIIIKNNDWKFLIDIWKWNEGQSKWISKVFCRLKYIHKHHIYQIVAYCVDSLFYQCVLKHHLRGRKNIHTYSKVRMKWLVSWHEQAHYQWFFKTCLAINSTVDCIASLCEFIRGKYVCMWRVFIV